MLYDVQVSNDSTHTFSMLLLCPGNQMLVAQVSLLAHSKRFPSK
jgi:hypothetical protein